MKYAVIGTGAVGGYFGAKLAKAGHEVHFLLHSDYEYVREHGMQIDSYRGSFHLDHVHAHRTTDDMPQCDVVIVGLKTTRNELLRELLPPVLHEHSLVLLIQNGIGVEADVQKMLPGVALAGGMAFICSAKVGPGHINHQFYGRINLGNYSCHDQHPVDSLIEELHAADIGAVEMEYNEARWHKALWNMPFNGMTVALECQTDELLDNPDTCELVRQQMLEVIGAARALGVKSMTDDMADAMIASTRKMVPYSPSMKLDHDYHRPMEIYYLYTRPIEEAARAGFAMPRLKMLEAQLKFIGERDREAE